MTQEDDRIKQLKTSPLISLTNPGMQEMSRFHGHDPICEVRKGLFVNSIVAQKHTLQLVGHITKTDTKSLIKKFKDWEKEPLTRPSDVFREIVEHFSHIANGGQDERDRGGIAVMERSIASPINQKMLDLFIKTVEYRINQTATSTSSSGLVLAHMARLPDGFVDDFVREMISDKGEQKKFRALLARELFIDIHNNLIHPPYLLVKELDMRVNHMVSRVNPLPEADIQIGKREIEEILRVLPFDPAKDFKAISSRLQQINPRWLQYFEALGWDIALKDEVTHPYTRRTQQISQGIFAELN